MTKAETSFVFHVERKSLIQNQRHVSLVKNLSAKPVQYIIGNFRMDISASHVMESRKRNKYIIMGY